MQGISGYSGTSGFSGTSSVYGQRPSAQAARNGGIGSSYPTGRSMTLLGDFEETDMIPEINYQLLSTFTSAQTKRLYTHGNDTTTTAKLRPRRSISLDNSVAMSYVNN